MPKNLRIKDISRDKCLDTWTRARDTEGCRNIGNFGDSFGGETFVVITA